MSDWQEIFERRGDAGELGGDFEFRVFAKIRRKKRQRQVGIGAAAVAAVALLLVIFQPFRPAQRRGPLTAAGKAEVPVSENMFFSTSDSRTRYSLQPVALEGGSAAPAATPNQI
ncbi:MAG: hypothetical protein MUF02_03105 [Acidobacteria bacterium]|jgi:hypothetical protein|nr:hypothetical protein [Acidobacteriota bacterium]